MLTVGSLFSGIGGLDLGFERAGFAIRWQVEIDPFCRAVLEKHWPDVTRFFDVRKLRRPPTVDVLCGGFPCQDISFAGFGAGLDGARSGLWADMCRIICEIRPRYVVVENVAALYQRGLGRVLGDLAGIGFDAEWGSLSACSMGQTHMRQRVFIVAYADGEYGRARLRDSLTRAFRPLQEVNGFACARARARARLADPSALYGGADGISNGLDRNHAIGNAVDPAVAQWIAERIKDAEGLT